MKDFWNFQIKIKSSILGGLGPTSSYSDACDHVWTSLDKFGAFKCIWTRFDTFGQVWTHLDRVWTSADRVWKSLEGVWRSLEKFGGV